MTGNDNGDDDNDDGYYDNHDNDNNVDARKETINGMLCFSFLLFIYFSAPYRSQIAWRPGRK